MERNLQDEFKNLISEVIAPALKIAGFKKNGLNFNRHFGDMTQVVNIQKSQYNHHERFLFTINLGFYNGQLYKLYYDRNDERKFITSDNCFVWGRSGMLIYQKDEWYELNQTKIFSDVYEQLKRDLENHILPLFDNYITLGSLIQFIRQESEDRPHRLLCDIDYLILSEFEFGDFDKGRSMLIERYKEAIIPKSTKGVTVYPDGREEVRWSEPSISVFYVEKLKRIAGIYKITL